MITSSESERICAEIHESKPLLEVELYCQDEGDYFTKEDAARLAKSAQIFLKHAARKAGLEDIITNVTLKRVVSEQEGKPVVGYTGIRVTANTPIHLNGDREKMIQSYASIMNKIYDISIIENNDYTG